MAWPRWRFGVRSFGSHCRFGGVFGKLVASRRADFYWYRLLAVSGRKTFARCGPRPTSILAPAWHLALWLILIRHARRLPGYG